MNVLVDKPMRYLRTDTDFWQLVDPASDYIATSTSSPKQKRRGEFIENLLSNTHITAPEIDIDDAIHAYIGTEDADESIIYDWRTHANVGESLRTVKQYVDYLDILESLGYDQNHAVVTTAIRELQQMVDAARDEAGLNEEE